MFVVIGHDDPRHGTDRGYGAGCRESCCRAGHAAAMWAYRQDPGPRLVDVKASTRRLEALACLGWSRQSLSRRLGMSRGYLRHLDAGAWCTRATAEKIAALYGELRGLPCPDRLAGRVRVFATRQGWVGPDAWADIDAGVLTVTELPEKICGCHPHVPGRRTLYAVTCMGCGWPTPVRSAA